METATATKMRLGATESRDNSNKTYVSLRTGKISEVSKDENERRPGFKPFTTKDKSGKEYHFFAKTYDDLTGYIDEIRWHEHTLNDGTRLSGWNITINTGNREYILQVQSNDRPYQTLMAMLPSVDFEKPVRIVAFMGKDKNNKPQKVFLMTQNPDQTAKDWIKPKYQAKWLSLLIAGKIKDGIELNEAELTNIAFDENGKPDGSFPYIREKRDGSWSFDAWTEFLFEKMETEVLPAVMEARNFRGEIESAEMLPDEETSFDGDAQSVEDDSIPF